MPGAAERHVDAVVVGGGFFGCAVALELARQGHRALLCEAADDLMQKASFRNQARVHNGYHYPRSLVTAARSRANFERFCRAYSNCVSTHFDMYYAIARRGSHVTAEQFVRFCRRIEAPLARAEPEVEALFDPQLVEAVFRVQEAVFDADALRAQVWRDLEAAGVEVALGTRVERVGHGAVGLELQTTGSPGPCRVAAPRVVNCSYAGLNQFAEGQGRALTPLDHEWTELCLVEVPEPLGQLGITVMCGPYFSLLPFPARGLHSLSHVRYTPHARWREQAGGSHRSPARLARSLPRRTRFIHMRADAQRYLPMMADCRHVDSLWGVKCILPRNATDDGRPILFRSYAELPGYSEIMGAKLDNVYDLVEGLAPTDPVELRPGVAK